MKRVWLSITLQLLITLLLVNMACAMDWNPSNEQHLVYSALLTSYFLDHGLNKGQAFLATLGCSLVWETVSSKWEGDSEMDLIGAVTGSLIVLCW